MVGRGCCHGAALAAAAAPAAAAAASAASLHPLPVMKLLPGHVAAAVTPEPSPAAMLPEALGCAEQPLV